MKRGSEDTLDAIHGLVAVGLKVQLEEAVRRASLPVTDPEYQELNNQFLDKALKFLKDNGVDSPGRGTGKVADLASTLANVDLDEVGIRGHA